MAVDFLETFDGNDPNYLDFRNFGRNDAKPALYCFPQMRTRFRMVYSSDPPRNPFRFAPTLNLNTYYLSQSSIFVQALLPRSILSIDLRHYANGRLIQLQLQHHTVSRWLSLLKLRSSAKLAIVVWFPSSRGCSIIGLVNRIGQEIMNRLKSVHHSTLKIGEIEMKTYRQNLIVVLALMAALALGAFGSATWARDGITYHSPYSKARRPVPSIVELGDARLKFEVNATDEDGGIQVFLDAVPWKSMAIFDPNGRMIFRSIARGSIGKQGGTELFLESGEPEFSEQSLEELFELFPEGDYRFFGRGLEREILVGTATLTHNIPAGPLLVSPLEGEVPVDPDNTVVQWEPVEDPNGSPIIAYQVLIVLPDSDFPALPKITLDVMMPTTAASLTVPPGFLLPDTEYEWEVLAIEESGNQTLSSSFFTTAP